VFVLYDGYRYGWDATTVGLTLAAIGVCFSLVQAVLVGHVVSRFGERVSLMLGLTFGTIGFMFYGLAPNSFWFWVGMPIMSLWGLSGPAIQGLMTRRVSASEQGQLQGANNSLTGISNMIGPAIFSAVFAESIGTYRDWNVPGAAFLPAALFLLASAVVAWHATRPRKA
jgi:DHA1 family tetracycline resistance protein-like MFS transporter